MTDAKGQREDANFFFCPRSFDRAVRVTSNGSLAESRLYDLQFETCRRETRYTHRVPDSEPCVCGYAVNRTARSTRMSPQRRGLLSDGNLRYQEAFD